MRPDDIELLTASFQRYFILGLFACSAASVVAVARAPLQFLTGSASNTTWSAVPWLILGLGLAVFAFWRIRFRIFWEAVFTLALFLGVWYLGLVVLSVSFGLLAASIVVLLPFVFHRVWAHDVFFFFGAVGVALNLSAQFPAELLIVVLAVTALYDIVAAPPGGVVAELAGHLVTKGFVPGFIIPPSLAFLSSPLKEVRKSDASLLGAGDLILPLILVAQSAANSLQAALLVSLGMLCGSFYLTRRPAQAPQPALPPLALGAGIPFIVFYVFSRLW
ncbi:MAG: hypothetical protein RDU25_01900 [Patescibacteria group bacterium]|nr:hypothetical protein [Patescibacteria group bacterium]